jgi:hypothetical protein
VLVACPILPSRTQPVQRTLSTITHRHPLSSHRRRVSMANSNTPNDPESAASDKSSGPKSSRIWTARLAWLLLAWILSGRLREPKRMSRLLWSMVTWTDGSRDWAFKVATCRSSRQDPRLGISAQSADSGVRTWILSMGDRLSSRHTTRPRLRL